MSKSSLWLVTSLVVLVTSSAIAQRPATPTPTRPATAPPATQSAAPTQTAGVIPNCKLALIYSDAFADPKLGLLKVNSMLTKLNAEFQKQKDDLTAMSNRGQQLEDEIKKLQQATGAAPIDQRSLQTKIDQLAQLKVDIQRKNEDATNAFNRRKQEMFGPLQEEIGRAIEAFAKAHGINVIVDGAQVPLLYAADSIDVTKAFITEFNSKNPVTASTTPPE